MANCKLQIANRSIRLGIVGTNFVSDWLAECAALTDGIEVTAVYSRKEESGKAFAEKHGITAVYTDYGEFLASDIDAVYIASPNCCHFDQTEKAMRNGKHILCEKPATVTEAEFTRLCNIAREENVVFLEAMRPAHDPVMEAVRSSLGKLGTLRRAVFEFCQYSSRYDRFKSGEILNAFNPKLGNAAVMDIGVYAIEACVMLFGEPDKVYSDSLYLDNGFEGMGSAKLCYGDFTAEIVYSKIYDSVSPSYISGEGGSITIGKISTGENVSVKLRGKDAVPLGHDRPENNMVYEIEDFVKAVRGELDCRKFHEYTRITLGIIEKILKK